MRGFWKSMLAGIMLAVLFGMPGLIKCSYAETDVTEKVELVKSRMMFDRSTSQNYLDVSIKNISDDVLLTPIKVVIDSIRDTNITIASPDGYTEDGKPFYQADVTDIFDGQLDIDGFFSQKIIFNNPLRRRFSYNVKITAFLPEPETTIGRTVEALKTSQVDNALINFVSYQKERMKGKLEAMSPDVLNLLADNIQNAELIEIDDRRAKYEITIDLPGHSVHKTNFYMYFENGAWRLGDL